MRSPFLSFVIPAKNEEGSVKALYSEIASEMEKLNKPFEIIFVDDGSTDKTFEVLKDLHEHDKRVKVVKLRGNWGKSVALDAGFQQAVGNLIFTMDADLQDNPKEIPKFLKKIDEGYDLVSGWKKKRHDPPSKVLPSRVFNYLVSESTGVKLHDINCGFKCYTRDVIESLNLYGELYRFIPVFAFKQNFKVAEIEVEHRARKFGKSKFGWERTVKGFLDLLTVFFMVRYSKRPGHFFGTLGLLSFAAGFLIGLYITYLRLTFGNIQDRQPLLFLGMLMMILGFQLISTGLIAEMIASYNQKPHASVGVVQQILD